MVRPRLVRGLVLLAAVAVGWALVVMWTGGAVWFVGGVRISSRGPRNPALVALLSIAIAWVVATPGQRGRHLAGEYQRLTEWISRRVSWVRLRPPVVAAIAAIGIVVVGLTESAGVAGGSDSYGYVSQAHLWTTGSLKQEPVLLRPLASEVAADLLTPLGYLPTGDGRTIAPTYSSGLPIVMAVFEWFAGRDSVFWVVPLLAGVLVWSTYRLGARLYSSAVGALAAVLVATASPVLLQLTGAPMSDLPAAAWWTLTFALASLDQRVAAVGAGIAAAAPILTRPNLGPVLVVAIAFLAARLIVARRPFRDVCLHVVLFALLAIPACFAVAALNIALWGSAVNSGYGPLGALFSVSNVWPNLLVYPRAITTLIPVALLAPVALFVSRERFATLSLGSWAAVAVLVYLPFPAYDSEHSLRFLIPAIPPLMVLASVAASSLGARLGQTHQIASLLVIATVANSGVHTARSLQAFDMEHERRYRAIGHYIARELPERAVLLAFLHSGSANYYSGRPTIRWDLLEASRLDSLVDMLRQRGYEPYLVIDAIERAAFHAQYRGHSRLGALDWQPLVGMYSPPVEIYSIPTDDTHSP
jgi:hypothetical protein